MYPILCIYKAKIVPLKFIFSLHFRNFSKHPKTISSENCVENAVEAGGEHILDHNVKLILFFIFFILLSIIVHLISVLAFFNISPCCCLVTNHVFAN